MAVKTIEARAVISAQDKTAGIFAAIGARAKALGKTLSGVQGGVGSAPAVRARASTAQRMQARADAVAARGAGPGLGAGGMVRGGVRAAGAPFGLSPAQMGTAGVAIATAKSVTDFANAERKMTRIGVTANATREDMRATMGEAQKLAIETAQPFDQIVEGMATLAAQGKTLKETRELIPSVARTAQAAGAEVADIAKTADAASSHLGITSKEMQTAFDLMAEGGKRGSFELKDMARYLPSLLPAAKALQIQGTKGLSDIVALMQMVRKSSGTSEEAASSMSDIMQKLEIEETTKKFKKMGVDSTAAFAKARKEGGNVFDVLESLIQQATKGDMSKLPQLFGDKEALRFARALMQDAGKWRKEAADMITMSPGTVMRDLGTVLADTKAPMDQLVEGFSSASRAVGSLIVAATPLVSIMQKIGAGADALSDAIKDTKFPKVDPDDYYKRRGLVPGVPAGGQEVLKEMAKREAKRQAEAGRLDGGNSFGGAAFGTVTGTGKKKVLESGTGVSRSFRTGPYAWDTGYDASAPHPPAKPGFLGGAMPASTAREIKDAIVGATPAADPNRRSPLERLAGQPGMIAATTPAAPASLAPSKVEAVVTAPVTAQLAGSAEVTGKADVAVTVTVDASGMAKAIAATVATLKGTLNAGSGTGRGSTGASSPDTGAQ